MNQVFFNSLTSEPKLGKDATNILTTDFRNVAILGLVQFLKLKELTLALNTENRFCLEKC